MISYGKFIKTLINTSTFKIVTTCHNNFLELNNKTLDILTSLVDGDRSQCNAEKLN